VGYFNGLTAGSFKTNAEGQHLFYPWGVLGKGYVLDVPQTANRVRRFLKLYYVVSLPLAVVIVNTLPWYYVLAVMCVEILVYAIAIPFLMRGLTTTSERLKFGESYANAATAFGPTTLGLLFAGSMLFVIGGIFIILTGKVGIGLATVLFFGACGVVYGYMLYTRS
jgi:hypothetical protein